MKTFRLVFIVERENCDNVKDIMDKFWDGCLIDGDCLQAESFEEIPNDSSVQEAYVVSKQQCKKNIERALLEGV